MPESQNKERVTRQLALSLHDLFDELFLEGFREIHSPGFQLRAAELLNHLRAEVSLKYALASLICHSAEEQEKFYRVFEGFIARHKPLEGELTPPTDPEASKPPPKTEIPDAPSAIPGSPGETLPNPEAQRAPNLASAARSGPITIELRFRDDGFRPWNLPELEPALRPFREKEWAESEDWDIPASIQKTIRGGGVPHFIRKQKRRAPQYLFLIQQKSVRDHLAAFYADLVKELLRRDVDADYFFYGDEPTRCWRDRRSPGSFTTLDRLYPSHKNSRLILIGEPTGLLKPLRIYPSALTFELRESWREIALLNTRSTALWGPEEETLCRLFPVAPASIAGLGSLHGQWQSRQSFTPAYWKAEQAESVPPNLTSMGSDPEWISKTIHQLKVYLGKYGITWLCAICVYPEIYWQMTKILHDEAISPVDVPEETRRNQIWHNALLQLCRLDWMRQGSIPPEFRQKLRNLLPASNAIEVRKELLRMLNWDENVARDKHSYAYQDREYTIALLQHEQVLKSQPAISEAEKARLDAAFRERLDQQGITVSDIADAVGREIFKKMVFQLPPSKGFRVLWVDDFPENNTIHVASIKKAFDIEFELAQSTEEAMAKIQNQTFNAIISDLGRGEAEWAGVELLQALKNNNHPIPVAIFASKRAVDNRAMLLQEGAQLATNSFADIEDWIGRLIGRESKPNEPDLLLKARRFLEDRNFDNTIEAFEKALGQYIRLGEVEKQAEALSGLGSANLAIGNLPQSTTFFEQAYDLYAKLGDKRNQSESLKSLSRVSRQMGELSRAKAYIQSALNIDQMIGNWGFTMHEMGEINEAMGNLEEAEMSYKEALETLEEEINDDRAWVDTQEALGRLAFKRGDIHRAWSYYQLVLRAIEEESSENAREANILAVLAEIELKRNNLAQSRQFAQRARALYGSLNDKENELRMEVLFNTIETYSREREQSDDPPFQQQETAQSQSGHQGTLDSINREMEGLLKLKSEKVDDPLVQYEILVPHLNKLIEENDIENAMDMLRDIDKQTGADIWQDVTLQYGNYRSAKKAHLEGRISEGEFWRQKAQARYALLELMKEIPRKIALRSKVQNLKKTSSAKYPDERQADRVKEENLANDQASIPITDIENISVNNSGVVLLAPYLPAFFKEIGIELLSGNQISQSNIGLEKQPPDSSKMVQHARAFQLLNYIVTGQEHLEKNTGLTLLKILCGLPPDIPITKNITLSNKEKAEANRLLESVINNWPALKNTSPDGLRSSFLQRSGLLSWDSQRKSWQLQIQRTSIDLLLDNLPWSYSMVKLPWMQEIIVVEW